MSHEFVADSSVGVAWAVKAQSNPATDRLREDVASKGTFLVPGLWMLEVANTLLMLMRRGRIAPEDRVDGLSWLIGLEPAVDESGWRLSFGRISDLAEKYSLTVYDAVYLELSLRRDLPLASRDAALNKAARRCGVETLL